MRKFVNSLFVGITVMWALASFAQENFLSVSSSTDGNGLFSYTFSLTNQDILPYVWGISSTNGSLGIQSYGIQNVICPSGWTSSVDANEYISLRPLTADTVFLGDPELTFYVQSSSIDAVTYNLAGHFVGVVYSMPDHQPVIIGYYNFSILGPKPVPEPSSIMLLALGILLVTSTKKFLHGKFVA